MASSSLYVGVDIGTYSIKVADLEPTSKSYVVRRIQEFPLSQDPTRDRKIEIIDTLRTLLQQYPPGQTSFIFGLPQKTVSVRLVTFPFRERFKVLKIVASHLEDELPFSQEDAVFEVKIVRFAGKTSDVLALAVPKERISEVIDLVHDCGVQPAMISADGFALANLFQRWDLPPPESLEATQEIPGQRQADIVLNIGHTSTEVLVMSEGLLLGVRNVDWGGKNMADAIGQKYGLNAIQSARELQTKGFVLLEKSQATREQIAFSEVLEGALQGLVSSLRLKMLELQSELNLQWAKGFMTGGGAHLKNLGAHLTQSLQVPFNRFKQFEHQAVSFEGDTHLELVSAVAVGLAVEGVRRPRNPATNFMKDEFAVQSRVFEVMWERWGYTARLAGAAFLILLVYSMIRDGLSLTLAERSDEVLRKQAEAVAGLKSRQASPEKVRRFISAQEKIDRARRQAEKVVKVNSALDVLALINGSLPPREKISMEIKRVQIDGDRAEVHGYGGTDRDRDELQKALQRASLNGKVESVGPRIPVPPGKVGFAYRFPVQRYSGG